MPRLAVGRGKLRVYVVTAPRATNTNLHAQGGLFTTDVVPAREMDQPVRIDPVDRLVANKTRRSSGPPVMVHMTLAAAQAGALLRLLHVEGVNAATIFPGFNGAAEALREREFWDRPGRAIFWLLPN